MNLETDCLDLLYVRRKAKVLIHSRAKTRSYPPASTDCFSERKSGFCVCVLKTITNKRFFPPATAGQWTITTWTQATTRTCRILSSTSAAMSRMRNLHKPARSLLPKIPLRLRSQALAYLLSFRAIRTYCLFPICIRTFFMPMQVSTTR